MWKKTKKTSAAKKTPAAGQALPRSRKGAYLGIMAALAVVLGYVETLLPVFIGVPGVKAGLPNIAIIGILYVDNAKDALGVSLVRVLLIGALFGNLYSILYSLCGALTSILVMAAVKKTNRFSLYGVSVLGGVTHNLAQLLVAVLVTQTLKLGIYFPVLLLAGVLSGLLIGFLGGLLTKRTKGLIHV